ncbi:Het-C-domain-containing protein [Microthyrium microscopicum]|uniref:Het-C-domain-containing protein n=1 Tax=Microthyrium microscopicum TaxID=703497 RepID=A0A6A6TXT3_9PEZI|nr:Het-C-domain-containing protein [Microthyrium microscopicum]
MASERSSTLFWLCAVVVCLVLINPVDAFGAGNIASTARIEGSNWRHGDIEDTLLGLFITRIGGGRKFSKTDVKRVYFGNWLRDYSQAVDVGTVKYVSAEAIRLLLWVLGFMSFGYGTREFEVTSERLGCYRPEEHIDNPKDYADNLDARQYDTRLRGPVDERRELAIDERTGLKVYIASEDRGITTSAGMVRNLLHRCIDLARRSRNKDDSQFFEALRLLGTATHCMEDYAAHSNYVELCLIEMGERDVFPHVGRRTQLQVRGARNAIFPIITGTFGGVDFLHSVCGELSDKATQSEIDELEGSINEAQRNQNVSKIKELLDQLPPGLFGGDDSKSKVDEIQMNAASSQMQNVRITPKQPEEFTRQMDMITQQVRPVLEFHDELMRNITEMIEKIPVLPDLIEELQNQISIFCFSVIAPFILPIIGQIKAELSTGSSEIIESSQKAQHIVFNDDNCSDPTHSMLSKDHFSNILNEPAGKTASQILKWAIPQIVECWDDPRADADRTINRIINGVFHHPALREQGDDGARDCRTQMFDVVGKWWQEKDDREKQDFRQKLSRDGVLQGRNHKEGVHDKGHGCGKPLSFAGMGGGSGGNNALAGALYSGLQQGLSEAVGGSSGGGQGFGGGRTGSSSNDIGKFASEAVGGGALGGILGGVLGGVGGSLLGGLGGGDDDDDNVQKQSYQNQSYDSSTGGRTTTYAETGRTQGAYGQAEYKKTEYPDGGQRTEFSRYEQDGNSGQSGGYGYTHTTNTRPTQSGYQTTEQTQHHGRRDDDDNQGGNYGRQQESSYGREQESGYGQESYGRQERQQESYGREESGGYGGNSGYGRQQESSYGRQERQQESYGQESSGYGRQERQQESYGREESGGYGGNSGYGRESEREEHHGRREHHQRRDSDNDDSDEEKRRRHHGRRRSGEYE